MPTAALVPAPPVANAGTAATTTAFVSHYDPPDVLLPSALPLSDFLVSSARDTFENATSGRDELSASDLTSLLAFLSIPSTYASHFALSDNNKGVTFDAFLRGLVSIRLRSAASRPTGQMWSWR
jgi:hypothetical protein